MKFRSLIASSLLASAVSLAISPAYASKADDTLVV